MKTYKYKIAHFTPDGIFLWSKEHKIEAKYIEVAFGKLLREMSEKGYSVNVDYELIYLTEV